MNSISERNIENELVYATSRSSGPGGQNVNKVNSRVELRFSITASSILTDDEKRILLEKLKTKITTEGELLLTCQTDRSQLKNKELVTLKFFRLIDRALKPGKNRIPTQPTKASKQKRIEVKKLVSQKKEGRKKPEL
jgi:ribosome-associated protein